MLKVDFTTDVKKFLAQHGDYLRRHEAEHTVILSMCAAALKKGKSDVTFAVLSNDEGVVMIAAKVPGRNIVLSRAAQDGIETLVDAIAEQKWEFPGIVGPADVAAAFSNGWTRVTGQKFNEYMDQIIYSLKTVTPADDVEGKMRLATEKDIPQVSAWFVGFSNDSHLPKSEKFTAEEAKNIVPARIAENRIYVWEAGGKAVAQAGVSSTETSARISLVYTPQENRGKGYASALVAAVSQKMLNDGKKLCCLYADARNPVSNSIYRKLGYEFVGRSTLYVRGED